MLSHWHKLPPALLYQQRTNLDEEPGCFSEMVCFLIAKQQLRLVNEHSTVHTGQTIAQCANLYSAHTITP